MASLAGRDQATDAVILGASGRGGNQAGHLLAFGRLGKSRANGPRSTPIIVHWQVGATYIVLVADYGVLA